MTLKTIAFSRGFSALLMSNILISLIWAARTQPAVPCKAPLQWEGRTVEYDHSSGRNIRAMVSYDNPNQRLRILEEKKRFIPCKKKLELKEDRYQGGQVAYSYRYGEEHITADKAFVFLAMAHQDTRFFEYIYLYKDAVMYQIEQETKLCSKISLSEPWDPYDIPDNSTYEDQYYIGGPGDQIMIQEWSDRKPARKLENWVGVYTVKDCYPVQETYTKNYSVTTSTRFFDLKLGISDPSVFIPPSTCQTAQSEKMTYVC